jgi:hypothetical protein
MKKDFLTPQAAANELTRLALQKADDAFCRMRRTMERQYNLANGTFCGV